MTDELWDKVLGVNGRGVFVGAREAAKRMTAAGRGGVIVNIVSTAASRESHRDSQPMSAPSMPCGG